MFYVPVIMVSTGYKTIWCDPCPQEVYQVIGEAVKHFIRISDGN